MRGTRRGLVRANSKGQVFATRQGEPSTLLRVFRVSGFRVQGTSYPESESSYNPPPWSPEDPTPENLNLKHTAEGLGFSFKSETASLDFEVVAGLPTLVFRVQGWSRSKYESPLRGAPKPYKGLNSLFS